jgi:predicted transposase YdaD
MYEAGDRPNADKSAHLGKQLLAYALIEHKSEPDRGARLQLSKYLVDVLTDWHEKNPGQSKLPILVPMIFHHGAEWRIRLNLLSCFGTLPDEDMRPYLVSFRHVLIDLAGIPDVELSDDPRMRAFLRLPRINHSSARAQPLQVLLADVLLLDKKDIIATVVYLELMVGREMIRAALRNLGPECEEKIMTFIDSWAEERRQEGRQQGLQEGKASMLLELLEERFGTLPSDLRSPCCPLIRLPSTPGGAG